MNTGLSLVNTVSRDNTLSSNWLFQVSTETMQLDVWQGGHETGSRCTPPAQGAQDTATGDEREGDKV